MALPLANSTCGPPGNLTRGVRETNTALGDTGTNALESRPVTGATITTDIYEGSSAEQLPHQQRRVLWTVGFAELLGTSMWFSGTAAIPHLTAVWGGELSGSAAAWLTMAVQLGFVVGALASAVFNLPDILHGPRMFAFSALLASLANAVFAVVAADHMWWALVLRFVTGAAMAGVYPVGMKILSGWFREGRGTALGVLVGSLTVGKGVPYLLDGATNLPWRGVVLMSSMLALVAAALVGFGVKEGPYTLPSPRVDFHQVRAIVHNRRLRLANLGYFGHMWELYSMWTWIALLLAGAAGVRDHGTAVAAFFAIAAGFAGCYWAGRVSDAPMGILDTTGGAAEPPVSSAEEMTARRIARRARVTMIAMAASGACCLLVPLCFSIYPLLVVVCLVWGVSVVADSAQFSTIVSEVSDRQYIGSALTMQTALGFLLTVVAIRITGAIAVTYGWRWAAASMAIGPALGIVAMSQLMKSPLAATQEK